MATFSTNPAATPLTGVEIVPITQGGVDKRTTTQDIAALASGAIVASDIPFSNSGFTADNVEDAIVEASGGVGGSDRSTVTAVTSASGVVTLNYALGDYFTITLSENVTSWVISNPPGSGKGFSLMVQITQAAGSYTVADPGTTAGGDPIDVSTANGAVDVLAISSFNNGTTLRSTIAKDFS